MATRRVSVAFLLACFCALTSAGHSFVPGQIVPFQPITADEYNAILDLSNGKPMISEARLIGSGLTAIKEIASNIKSGAMVALNFTGLEPIYSSIFNNRDRIQGYPLCVVRTNPVTAGTQRSNPYHPQPGYTIYPGYPVNPHRPHSGQGPEQTVDDTIIYSGIGIEIAKGTQINGSAPVVNCVVVLRRPVGAGTATTTRRPPRTTAHPPYNPHYPVGPYPQHPQNPGYPQYPSNPYYPQHPHQPTRQTTTTRRPHRPHPDDDNPHRRPGNDRPSHRPDDDDDDDDYHRRPSGNDRPSHRPGNNRPSNRPDDDDYPHRRPGNYRPSNRPDDDRHRDNYRPSRRPDHDRRPGGYRNQDGTNRPSSYQENLVGLPLYSYPIIPILAPYQPYGSHPHANSPKSVSSSDSPENYDADEEGGENYDGMTAKVRHHYFGSGAKAALYNSGTYKAPESNNDVEVA